MTQQEKIREELIYRRVQEDAFYWLTQLTKTQDEQDPLAPFKPFPDKRYFLPLIKILETESPLFFEKSRTMMLSWLVSGWAAHKGFTRPATKTLFQSQDEDRAVTDIKYVKHLWRNSEPFLKERWPLKKDIEAQPEDRFTLANGSEFVALVGNPDKVRSEHPTIYVLDEAAHVDQGEASWNVALATGALHMIALSSMAPGWYADKLESAVPCDWPSYAAV